MARPRKFNEEEILEKAMFAFWSRGYDAVTFRSLSAETGLALRSLSNAFQDKETLYIRALEMYVGRVEENLPKLLAGGGVSAIRRLFENVTGEHPPDSPRQCGCFVINQMAIAHLHDDRLTAVIDRYFDVLRTNYRAALAQDGLSDLDARTEMVVTAFIGTQMNIRLAGQTTAGAAAMGLIQDLTEAWLGNRNPEG